jgi:hypothetical protein
MLIYLRKGYDNNKVDRKLTEVYVNVRKHGKQVILATCDCELLGKVLNDGEIMFEVREEFYKGVKVTTEEAIELCKQSTIVNMIGKCIVDKAIQAGLVHPEAILKISGVPHAQLVKL